MNAIKKNTLKLILGTRGSELALWQARFVQDQLCMAGAEEVEIRIIKTRGDVEASSAFAQMAGEGFFFKRD